MKSSLLWFVGISLVLAFLCTLATMSIARTTSAEDSAVFVYLEPYLCNASHQLRLTNLDGPDSPRIFACVDREGQIRADVSGRFWMLLFGLYFLFFLFLLAVPLIRSELQATRTDVPLPHYGDDVAAVARAELQRGRKIAAIKEVRRMTGADLITAKAYVEWLERDET